MDMVDNQIVIIALPTIQHELNAHPSALQWTATTGYTLFLVNVPIALVAAIGAALVMPAPRRTSRGATDLLGVVLLAATLVALLYPLMEGRELDWPLWTFGLLVAAVPLLAAFVAQQRARERRGAEPLIRLGLFRNRAMAARRSRCCRPRWASSRPR